MPLPMWSAPFTIAKDPASIVAWLVTNGKRLAQVMQGPKSFSQGNANATATVVLADNDLTMLTLNANTTITLDLQNGAGQALGCQVALQLTQDLTGGRTVTWVNAVWSGGTPPTIQTAASAITVIQFLRVPSGWFGFFAATPGASQMDAFMDALIYSYI